MILAFWNWLDRYLFGEYSEGNTPGALVLRVLRYPYAVLRDLSRGQINLHAMGLVYATLLSLVPLIAFAFAVLKAFGAHRELEPLIHGAASRTRGAAPLRFRGRPPRVHRANVGPGALHN